MIQQIVREYPPGFGGIERVSHCLAEEIGGTIYFLRDPKAIGYLSDPLLVKYNRIWLRSISIGKLFFPLPSKQILRILIDKDPLIGHVPCPTIFFLCLAARFFNRSRTVILYWHALISPKTSLSGFLEFLYQKLAYFFGPFFPVIVTSPVLKDALLKKGFKEKRLYYLPCSLPHSVEKSYQIINKERKKITSIPNVLIAICRLDSYKRVDWLIDSFSQSSTAKELIIIGDGPDRAKLEYLAKKIKSSNQTIRFYGTVDEKVKIKLLTQAHLLVLPSDRSNEAFGIVQLEAMASGIPSLAYELNNSGMYWVSKLPCLNWNGKPKDMIGLVDSIFNNNELYNQACFEARQRYDQEFSEFKWKELLSNIQPLIQK